MSVCCADTYHFEELVHAAHIVILLNTKDVGVASETAYRAGRLSHDQFSSFSSELKPLRTKTGILAAARWAADLRVDAWTRYYSFVGPILQMTDELPFKHDPQLSPANPKVGVDLKRFEQWYQARRSLLEQEAAAERPRLKKLAEELADGEPMVWALTP